MIDTQAGAPPCTTGRHNVNRLTATGEGIAKLLATDKDMIALAKPSDMPTTRSDYGNYMTKLMQVSDMLGSMADNLAGEAGLRIAARAMELAGGDARGIYDALHICLGEPILTGAPR